MLAAVAEEIGIGALGAAPNPAAELVKLGQAKRIAAIDNQGVGVGDIQARFDDGGTEQHVNFTAGELVHYAGQV